MWPRSKSVKIVATDIYGAYGKTEDELDRLDVARKRRGPLAVTGRSGSLEGWTPSPAHGYAARHN